MLRNINERETHSLASHSIWPLELYFSARKHSSWHRLAQKFHLHHFRNIVDTWGMYSTRSILWTAQHALSRLQHWVTMIDIFMFDAPLRARHTINAGCTQHKYIIARPPFPRVTSEIKSELSLIIYLINIIKPVKKGLSPLTSNTISNIYP